MKRAFTDAVAATVNISCWTLSAFLLFLKCFEIHAASAVVEQKIRRVDAHLLIGDEFAACHEGKELVAQYPCAESYEVYIAALARAGEEREMMRLWNIYREAYPDAAEHNRALQEAMAWGTIFKGAKAASPVVRLAASLAAFFGQDAKSVKILREGCDDSNSALRGMILQLCSQLHDAPLIEKVIELAQRDKCWKVRLEAIKAIGSMRIKQGKPLLHAVLDSAESSPEEKAVATKALISLIEDVSRDGMERLVYSNRMALRLLAAEGIAYLQSKRDVDLLLHLCNDYHADVRTASLHALGILRREPAARLANIDLAISKLQDPSSQVSITAAWLLALNAPELAKEPFAFWLGAAQPKIRHQAAAALVASGLPGRSLMQHFFTTCTDPFVRMNLAIGLIQQHIDMPAATAVLKEGVGSLSQRWMWDEDSPFRALTPSSIRFEDESGQDPEALNQIARLEILNLLAIARSSCAEEAIKDFLKQKKWGISGMAATLLLCEGDETAVAIVRRLLDDPDLPVRLQAALVLSLWEKEENVISILQDAYSSCERELKERILEGLGRIGSMASVLFLVDKLQEPQQILRIIAAGSLLQCLH